MKLFKLKEESCSPKGSCHIFDCVVNILKLFDNFIGNLDFEFVLDSDHDFDVIELIDTYFDEVCKYRVPTTGY